jgi:hypothetical protein
MNSSRLQKSQDGEQMSVRPFETKLDADQYYAGLARQQMDFHQALGELIDNSLSARRPASHGIGFEPTVIEITIEEAGDLCIVQLADPGIGIGENDLMTRVFNPGGQGQKPGAMNEHGFGLKNALALLTGGNKTNFSLITRDHKGDSDVFLGVHSPLGLNMSLDDGVPADQWKKDLFHLTKVETGTKVRVEVHRRFVNTLYSRARNTNFDTLMTRLGEHLGVMYRQYLDQNTILLAYKPKDHEWVHKRIQPVPVPYVGDAKTTEKSFDVGGKTYAFKYTRGFLDYTVKEPQAEQEKGWPYPLKIYYQGSNARCGVDISVRERVILSGQFESIWPETSKTVDFNRFVGEIRIGPEFRTTNNKTNLDPHGDNWEELLHVLQGAEFRPETATRSHSEESLRDDLVKILKGTFSDAKVRTNRAVWAGGVEVDIEVESEKERRIYELKVTPARVLDVYQLLMGWDGLVREGASPNIAILVAKEISQPIKDAVDEANKRKDGKGNPYKMEARTIDELLPEYVKAKLKK